MQSNGTEEKTPKQAFIESVARLISQPSERALGAVKKTTKALLSTKEKGTKRLVILGLAKAYYNLLPSYNIHTKGFKYNKCSKSTSYEYLLMQEWQGYLRMVTRSKTDESYEAAAILLPQTVLFNKSCKLVGKVIKGTAIKTRTGKKCVNTLKKIFRCDKGNRIVRILEVFNQMNLDKVSHKAIKTLRCISDEVLKKPQPIEKLNIEETRKLTVEEKAIKKEAQLQSLPEEIKAWKGINERLLRIYLLLLVQRKIENYWYVLQEIQRLRIPGNLQEGIYTVLMEKIKSIKAEITPKRVPILALLYMTLHKMFGEKLEFSFQQEDLEKIPIDVFIDVDDKDVKLVYSSLKCIDKHQGHPNLIKLLIKRGMYRIDNGLPEIIRHLMPREGAKALDALCEDGFWELSLLRRNQIG